MPVKGECQRNTRRHKASAPDGELWTLAAQSGNSGHLMAEAIVISAAWWPRYGRSQWTLPLPLVDGTVEPVRDFDWVINKAV